MAVMKCWTHSATRAASTASPFCRCVAGAPTRSSRSRARGQSTRHCAKNASVLAIVPSPVSAASLARNWAMSWLHAVS